MKDLGYIKVSSILYKLKRPFIYLAPSLDQPLKSLSFPRAWGFGTIDGLVDFFVGGMNLPDFP